VFTPINLDATEPVTNAETIHIFTLGGVDYHMPAVIPGNLALQVLDRIAKQGEAAAIAWALEEVLGAGYHALLNHKGLQAADLKAILDGFQTHLMGALEELTGN
jgi:hypothetical protein